MQMPVHASRQDLIGQSSAFVEMLEQVSRIAALDRPVLVVGERGTGKELIAERLHFLSGRWDQSLVKLNCAAISPSLLESELFGHEAGAFTDATSRRVGRFEQADGGSLMLDELATSSITVQEKILRVIEYGEFERLGSSETRNIDVRVIGATHDDLPGLVARGRFRADLLDRLSFDVITLPPLRARLEDIEVLAEHFAVRMSRELGRALFAGFSSSAREQMLAYPWPGNVRELKNVIERAVTRTEDEQAPVENLVFDPFQSPWRPRSDEPPTPPIPIPDDLRGWLARQEAELVERALQEAGGNRKRAAKRLGLTYDQFRGILRKSERR